MDKMLGIAFMIVWAIFFFYIMFTFDLAPKRENKERK